MTTLETIAARHLARLVDPPIDDPSTVDVTADLVDTYGVTSLAMMLLITSICDETGADLARFTDDDLGNVRTLGAILQRIAPAERVGS
jgi:acyl carrier protein